MTFLKNSGDNEIWKWRGSINLDKISYTKVVSVKHTNIPLDTT